MLVKSRLLKLVVHIGSQYEIILILHQRQQFLINQLRGIQITVTENVPAPISPMFFQRIKRIEAAGVHIRKVILGNKVREVMLKPLPGICEAC